MVQRIYRSIWVLRASFPATASVWTTMAIYGALLVPIGVSGFRWAMWMNAINHKDGVWVWFVIGAAYGHAKWWGAKNRCDAGVG
jgi:hypothetical protein